MQNTPYQLSDVVEMLDRSSDHYKDCSLEWAKKKEQYAAEWDKLLMPQNKVERLKKLRDAMRCQCGAMPEDLESGESYCKECGDGELVESITCDDCNQELPSQKYKDDHSGFCSDCLLTFNL